MTEPLDASDPWPHGSHKFDKPEPKPLEIEGYVLRAEHDPRDTYPGEVEIVVRCKVNDRAAFERMFVECRHYDVCIGPRVGEFGERIGVKMTARLR